MESKIVDRVKGQQIWQKKSTNWEGPYQIKHCGSGNIYILETLKGEEGFGRAIEWGIFEGILP